MQVGGRDLTNAPLPSQNSRTCQDDEGLGVSDKPEKLLEISQVVGVQEGIEGGPPLLQLDLQKSCKATGHALVMGDEEAPWLPILAEKVEAKSIQHGGGDCNDHH